MPRQPPTTKTVACGDDFGDMVVQLISQPRPPISGLSIRTNSASSLSRGSWSLGGGCRCLGSHITPPCMVQPGYPRLPPQLPSPPFLPPAFYPGMLATTKMKPCIEKSAEPVQKQPESLIHLILATNILILAILLSTCCRTHQSLTCPWFLNSKLKGMVVVTNVGIAKREGP